MIKESHSWLSLSSGDAHFLTPCSSSAFGAPVPVEVAPCLGSLAALRAACTYMSVIPMNFN